MVIFPLYRNKRLEGCERPRNILFIQCGIVLVSIAMNHIRLNVAVPTIGLIVVVIYSDVILQVDQLACVNLLAK